MATKKLRFWNGLRRLGAFFPAAALILFFSSLFTSHAALQFDAIVGYNGVIPQNCWFPITCELHNDGPSFTGVIEVSQGQMGGHSQTRKLIIELPTNTRKRVMIPVFADASYQGWTVRLLSERGKLLAEPNYNGMQKALGVPVMAALSRNSAGVPVLPVIKSRNSSSQPVAVRLQPELFPENPLLLDGIPLLYLNSQRALELTAPQVNALLAWLHHGGHLVIGAEQATDLSAAEWLKNLMPCDLKEMNQLARHSDFQNWLQEWRSKFETAEESQKKKKSTPQDRNTPLTDLSMADDPVFEAASLPILTGALKDGKIVLGNRIAPLAIQAMRGSGRITVLTFSPEREPFASWKNRGWFWAKLAEVSPDLYVGSDSHNYYGSLNSDEVFGSMIDSKQVRKLPLGWLLLLLVAYLIVIGPLDRYWLRKINRQMLTWITFPLYVLGFSGLIYLIGFHLRNGDLEWNELSMVDIMPTEQLSTGAKSKGAAAILRGQTYCSIYSPVNDDYQITGGQPFGVFRDGGQISSHAAAVLQHGHSFEASVFVPVWSSRLFVSDWLQPAPAAPLTFQASPTEKGWNVSIENKTDRKLTQARVVLGGRIYDLGELPSNQTNQFSLNIEKGEILSLFVNRQAQNLKNAAQSRHNNFGDNVVFLPDTALGATTASFASMITSDGNGWNAFSSPCGLDLGKAAERDRGILLAWDADHSYTQPLNQFTTRRSHRDTLLRMVIPVKSH